MDKLWKDCSHEERNEVRRIKDNLRYAKDKLQKGKITREQYLKKLDDLEIQLKEVEKKYD